MRIVFKKSRKIHRILVTVFISKRRNEVESGDEEIFSLYLQYLIFTLRMDLINFLKN